MALIDASGSPSATAGLSAELRSATLAKDQQEQEGQQAIQLLESAEAPQASSGDLSRGGNIDTFA